MEHLHARKAATYSHVIDPRETKTYVPCYFNEPCKVLGGAFEGYTCRKYRIKLIATGEVLWIDRAALVYKPIGEPIPLKEEFNSFLETKGC